ncbi:hypothetical protein [Desulfosporosinus sp. SB140]|uniref:hypothetical protein n=1 Tax=Desulfosporosinus paludis TaxID=3115649 RepID=UPI0038908A61
MELSIFTVAFYCFNPAIFVNSTIWGQVDSFFTLIVIAGVVLLAEQKLVYILWQTDLGINQAARSAIPVATSILNLLLFMYLVKIMLDLTIRNAIQ